jgi:hypothetical protein
MRVSHRRVLHGRVLHCVYLTGMDVMGMHLIGMHLIGVSHGRILMWPLVVRKGVSRNGAGTLEYNIPSDGACPGYLGFSLL